MTVAQHRLGAQLVLLYQAEEPDPLAILLGATSLAEALEGLESLSRTARVTEGVIRSARAARVRVARERRALDARQAEVARLQVRAEAALGSLLSASEERASYIERLRADRRLNERQIAALEQRAREAQERAEQLASTPAGDDATSPPASRPAGDDGGGSEPEGPSAPPESPVESVGEEVPAQPPPPAPPPPQSGKQLRVVPRRQ